MFLPLKNSGRARRSMAWTLQGRRGEERFGEGSGRSPLLILITLILIITLR